MMWLESFDASRWSYANLVLTGLLLSVVIVIAGLYLLRLAQKGRAQYDRIDKQGGSALLNKGLMEMAYWSLQPLGRLLVALHITPNQLSWASFVFGILSGAAIAYGHFGFAGFFAVFAGFLDSLDGMVARLTGVSSEAGEVLDATIDRYVEGFFLSGLTIYYREFPALQVLTSLALLGSFMVSYSTAKAEAMQMTPPKGSMRRPERAMYLTLGAILSPISITLFESTRAYANPVGYPMVLAVGLIAVLSNVSAGERMYAIAQEARRREEAAKKNEKRANLELHSEDEDHGLLSDSHARSQHKKD